MEMCMLTTTDNPYDPFTQYEAWYRFDEDNGYHSCAFLARIARTSDQLSDKENQEEIERAVRAEGQVVLGWRDVPVDRSMPMSPAVRNLEPVIRQ